MDEYEGEPFFQDLLQKSSNVGEEDLGEGSLGLVEEQPSLGEQFVEEELEEPEEQYINIEPEEPEEQYVNPEVQQQLVEQSLRDKQLQDILFEPTESFTIPPLPYIHDEQYQQSRTKTISQKKFAERGAVFPTRRGRAFSKELKEGKKASLIKENDKAYKNYLKTLKTNYDNELAYLKVSSLPKEEKEELKKFLELNYSRGLKMIGMAGMICTGVRVNLKDFYRLHLHMRNSVFNERWKSLHFNLTSPQSSLIVYQENGSIQSFQTKNYQDLTTSLKKSCLILKMMGIEDVTYHKPLIMNIIQTYKLHSPLNFFDYDYDDEIKTHFELINEKSGDQRHFPSIELLDKETKVLTTIFENGTLIFKIRRRIFVDRDIEMIEETKVRQRMKEAEEKGELFGQIEEGFKLELEKAKFEDELFAKRKRSSDKYKGENPKFFTLEGINNRILTTFVKIKKYLYHYALSKKTYVETDQNIIPQF